jgi:superoxide dismutase
MKRTFAILSVLSLALAVNTVAFGATSSTPKPEHLTKQQLNTLISTAKTSADHERIAQYYQAKTADYLAQAKDHEAMIAAYKANPVMSNDKNQASTISHCEYFVQTFKALAENSQVLAANHERMAADAPQKLIPAGN